MFPRDNIRITFTVMHYLVFDYYDALSFAFLVCVILYIDGIQFRCSVFTSVQYVTNLASFQVTIFDFIHPGPQPMLFVAVFLDCTSTGKKLFVAFPWVETGTGPEGFMICVFIIRREPPKAQPKVVLWRSRESNLRPLVYKA